MNNSCYKEKLDKKLLFVLLLSTTLIVAGLSYPILQYGVLGILFLYIIFSDSNKILQLLAYVGVFAPIFKTSPDGFAFINIILLISMAKLVVLSDDGFSITYRQGIWMTVLLAVAIASVKYFDFDDVLLLAVSIILMICLLRKPENIDYHSVLVFFSLGIIVASFLGFFMESVPNLGKYVHYGQIRVIKAEDLVSRFGGLQGNPNHYTIDVSIALGALLAYNMGIKFKKFDVILMGVLLIFGLMSVSKSFVISVAIMVIFVILFQKNKSLNKKIFTFLTISSALFIVYLFVKDTVFFDAILKRFQNDSGATLATITTGRTDIWKMYFDVFKEDIKIFLIGAGISVPDYRGIATHNFFIEILYHIGFLGTFCYFKAIKSTMPPLTEKPKNKLCYIVWLVLLVRMMAANFFYKEMLFLYFVLSYLAIYDYTREANNRKIYEED